MERQVGEVLEYDGVTLKVVNDKGSGCEGCYFCKNESSCSYGVRDIIGPCGEYTRSDMQSVIFKRIKRRKHEDK